MNALGIQVPNLESIVPSATTPAPPMETNTTVDETVVAAATAEAMLGTCMLSAILNTYLSTFVYHSNNLFLCIAN